ncbi:hypothetical protein niasHT_034718 [Heterodera trifolii]|uniref:Uncharacterized protein n=1 Tax=Heterodera trifolii TaxID=157864 RepID=A0ABD2HWZ7_9BILA
MPTFLLISVFGLLLLWPKSLAIQTEDVKNFADEFSSLTSSTWDTISKLRFVSQHAATFVRVAGPVGALIAAGADVAFKPDSEELIATEKLHDYVKTQFGVLSRQALIASHCAEISYDGEKGRIEEEYGQIELLLSEIAAHMVDWICAKLIITWPIISSEYAKTAIGNSPIIESEAEYEKVALNIKHVLDQMGEEKYLHTVIVFPNWTDERQLASICSVQYCFKLTDINGINVFVVRYEDDQYERAVRTSEWFTPTIQIKMIKIISDWWESNRSEPLIGLAWRMKHEFEELINANFYANLVLIRNWMFFSSAATMTLGVTPTKIRSARTELGFNYKIIPPILDAEIFHIHMLI